MAGELVRVNGKLGVLVYQGSEVKVLFRDSILVMERGAKIEYTGEMVVIDSPTIRNGMVADVVSNDLKFITSYHGQVEDQTCFTTVPTNTIKWYKTKRVLIPTLSELFKVLEDTGYTVNGYAMMHPEYPEIFKCEMIAYTGKDKFPYPVRDEWCCQVYSWPAVELDNLVEMV
jgi:hypothetical protein